jgi:enoyl-CoA hydratase/carnithine racemase
MSNDDLVRVEREGHVALLTFNDPDRLNAMTGAMGQALAGAVDALRGESIRAAVLTGSGRAFSAGGDLEMLDRNASRGEAGGARRAIRDEMRTFYGLFLTVRELPCPTIAAINGPAIGAGLCVALSCDMRIAASTAKLGLNFNRLGLHPGMGATWTLPRIVGPAIAAEILYTGRTFDGEEALRMGLVNRAVPAESVVESARGLADEIAEAAPLSVAGTRRSLARSAGASLEEQLHFEAHEQAGTFESRDAREGITALRERRAPRFEGA